METLKGDLLYNQQRLWGSLQIVVSTQTSLMVSYVFLSLFSKQTPHFGRALSLLSGKVHMPDVVASVSSNGFILLAEDPLLRMNTSGHDSVQEQSLFMDVGI